MHGFEVAPGDLRVHADKVDGHAQALGQAADAAGQAMPDAVYGIICQFLPPLFNEIEQAAAEALEASRAGLEAVSTKLHVSADSYESRDAAARTAFGDIAGRMQ